MTKIKEETGLREWLEEKSIYWNIYDSARVIITSLAYYYYFYLLYGGKKNITLLC